MDNIFINKYNNLFHYRVLHGVSKFISNKKLEFYFKTYNDVKDKILTITPIPKISELWCFERYKCNDANVTRDGYKTIRNFE